MINCKIEWKLKWTKYNDNDSDKDNNIIFNINDTILYVPSCVPSYYMFHNYENVLAKEFERSVHWNQYKTKSEKKISQMNIDIFSNQFCWSQ